MAWDGPDSVLCFLPASPYWFPQLSSRFAPFSPPRGPYLCMRVAQATVSHAVVQSWTARLKLCSPLSAGSVCSRVGPPSTCFTPQSGSGRGALSGDVLRRYVRFGAHRRMPCVLSPGCPPADSASSASWSGAERSFRPGAEGSGPGTRGGSAAARARFTAGQGQWIWTPPRWLSSYFDSQSGLFPSFGPTVSSVPRTQILHSAHESQ